MRDEIQFNLILLLSESELLLEIIFNSPSYSSGFISILEEIHTPEDLPLWKMFYPLDIQAITRESQVMRLPH